MMKGEAMFMLVLGSNIGYDGIIHGILECITDHGWPRGYTAHAKSERDCEPIQLPRFEACTTPCTYDM